MCCTWQRCEQALIKLIESHLNNFLTELFLKDTKFVIRSSSEKRCLIHVHAEAARTKPTTVPVKTFVFVLHSRNDLKNAKATCPSSTAVRPLSLWGTGRRITQLALVL